VRNDSLQDDGRDGRGRTAERPSDIPPRGWLDVLKRVKAEVKDDNVSLLAAGVAFYAMLAIFPAIIAVVTIYGLVTNDPGQVQSQLGEFARGLPQGAGDLLVGQLESVTRTSQQSLTIGLVASLAAVLWSASSGMQALIKGLNAAYDEKETRGFVKLRGLSLLLTIGAIVVVILTLALIAVVPAILDDLGLGSAGELAARYGRWPVLALLVAVAIAVLYRYAPDRKNPRWRWVSWGAVLAVALWLVGSAGFSFYVSNFGKYNETYGSVGAVIVLLLWLFLSSFVVLLGAEVDAEIERQTRKDTTEGPERPLGERDATAADTVGESAAKR
jgi:membrane protein